jgi:8-oxo-dGTP pyrophosphatase MutT (NUDIX family)
MWNMMSQGHPFEDDMNDRVGVIVLDAKGRLLIVKGMTGKYSLPKGSRKRGETEWEGATREAWEEAGIDLERDGAHMVRRRRLNHGIYFEYTLDDEGGAFATGPKEETTLGMEWVYPNSKWFQSVADKNHDLSTYAKKCMSGGVRHRRISPKLERNYWGVLA